MNKFDQLDELSKKTLGRYIVKATDDKKDQEKSYNDVNKLRNHIDNIARESPFSKNTFKKRAALLGKSKEDIEKTQKDAKNAISRDLWDREMIHNTNRINREKGINRALKKLTKEDVDSLISSAANAEPATFAEQFNDIVLSKIEERLEEFKDYLTQTMYNEEEQIDELSSAVLKSYRSKASNSLSDSLSKNPTIKNEKNSNNIRKRTAGFNLLLRRKQRLGR